MIESLAPKRRDEFGTVPNFITLLGFFFGILYIEFHKFSFLFFAACTDFVDGLWARWFKQETFWGAILDPLRDRFLLLIFLWQFWSVKVGNLILIIIMVEIITGIINFSAINRIDIDKKISHLFGKTRQAGHLGFGVLGLYGIITIEAAVSILLLFSVAALGGTASLIKRRKNGF